MKINSIFIWICTISAAVAAVVAAVVALVNKWPSRKREGKSCGGNVIINDSSH